MDDHGDLTGPQAGGLELDPVSGRVLGCLVEKAMTTPDHYPMSLNAVVVACNQVSNRDPVVDYDAALVERTLRALADQGLAKLVHRPGDRVVKYRQAVGEVLEIGDPEASLLAVLMLRGPQTPGELRQRTARYVDFESLATLERSLRTLQERTPPLVTRLERRPGQKEYRYQQLLAREDGPTEAAVPTSLETPSDDADPEPGPSLAPPDAEIEALRVRVEALEYRLDALLAELGLPGSAVQDAGDL